MQPIFQFTEIKGWKVVVGANESEGLAFSRLVVQLIQRRATKCVPYSDRR